MSAKLWEQPLWTLRVKKRAQAALRAIWLFFQKQPQKGPPRANRKGQGFHLFTPPQKIAAARKRLPAPALAGCGAVFAAVIFCAFLAMGMQADLALLVGAMLALCGLIAYDISTRRVWEKRLSRRIEELCDKHDRMVRETARNRSDIASLKQGLGELAHALGEQGSRLTSTEARMIDTIVSRLGALGDAPRAALETSYDREILELEMAPPPSAPPPLSDLGNAINPDFAKYSDTVIAELVHHAVRKDAIDLFMQPVVSLPQRKPRMHEVYARIRAGAGAYIPAERFLGMAQKERLLPAIDNLLLLRCLKALRDQGGESGTPYIINVSGATLNDRGFMNELVAFLSQNHKMANRLILELPQKDLTEQGEVIGPVIGGLAKLGCRFSMDRVRNRTIDINFLKGSHIRFIKLDAGWILKESQSQAGFSRVARLKKQLDAAGIDLIAERIESETTLRELLDFSIDYGQGYLFGKPDHQGAYREGRVAA